MCLHRMASGTNAALSVSVGTVDVGSPLYNGKLFYSKAEEPLPTCQHNHIAHELIQHVGLAG